MNVDCVMLVRSKEIVVVPPLLGRTANLWDGRFQSCLLRITFRISLLGFSEEQQVDYYQRTSFKNDGWLARSIKVHESNSCYQIVLLLAYSAP